MSIAYDFDDATGIVFVTAGTELSRDELVQLSTPSDRDERFLAYRGVLLDLSAVETVGVSSSEIRDAAGLVRANETPLLEIKLAIVASSDVTFGLARMFQSMRNEERTLRVFRDRLGAIAWLDDKGENA